MKISVNWLKDYIKIDLAADELVKRLVDIGFDIENIENQSESLNNFVIGKVIERIKHPNADKLSVCKVDVGTETRQIVCGAPNVDAGQTVCVALPGAIIPNGGFEIKKSKIRGEESNGMICSAKELNLGDDQGGIMVLNSETSIIKRETKNEVKPGMSFAEYAGYDDVIIEIGVTPNRGDLLSHFGVAQEISAITDCILQIPNLKTVDVEDLSKQIKVEIENPKGCYRYCGRLVKNIKVKESPGWLKKKLTAVGLRPINNIVDITNFVMMECGQPLHAFDYDRIAGKIIIVKDSSAKQKFTTLDGKERELRDGILLICNGEKPVALAGIMGGQNSEISETTKNVFVESAYFEPVLTRKSSKYLGLQTDSSYRFERGVDIERTSWAANRAAELIAELGGGEIVEGLIDEYPNKIEQRIVELRMSYLNKIIGRTFETDEVKNLLGEIGIECIEQNGEVFKFKIPFSRNEDLKQEIDLVEEVARLYGYKNIDSETSIKFSLDLKEYSSKSFDYQNRIRKHLAGRGFKEIISNSLISHKISELTNERHVSIINPSSELMNTFRNNLFISALEIVKFNLNRKAETIKLFEIGDVLKYEKSIHDGIEGVRDRKMVLILMAGNRDYFDIEVNQSRQFNAIDINTEIEALLEKLNVEKYNISYYNASGSEEIFKEKAEYICDNEIIATVYQFSKNFLRKSDINTKVYACQLN